MLAKESFLAPDQRQAVEEVMAGAKSVHALPLRTAAEVDDLVGIVGRAYQQGLRIVLWLSAGLVVVAPFFRPAVRKARRGAPVAGGR